MVKLLGMTNEGCTEMSFNPIYNIKEALKNLKRNSMMSIASVTSVAATLIILGIIFALIINVNSMTLSVRDQFESIQVYISEDASAARMESMASTIHNMKGVKDISFVTKDQALEQFKEEWGENGYILEGMTANPLPNSFIIYLSDIQYSDEVIAKIEKMQDVDGIRSTQDVISKLISLSDMVRQIGFILIIILICVSTFIIHNTIKLTVNSRRKEIVIMKYVGATSWFIRWPFIIEGTILGLLGALLSVGLLNVAYGSIFDMFTSDFYVLIAAYIIPTKIFVNDMLYISLIIGAGIGALGSLLSLRRHLEV